MSNSIIRKCLSLAIIFSLLFTTAVGPMRPLVTKSAAAPVEFTTHFTYDPNGNLETRTDATEAKTSYEYDALNRLIAVHYPDKSAVTYTYDAVGQRTRITDTLGTTSYEYDIHGRMTSITDPNGHTLRYEYDPRGLLTRLIYPDGSVVSYTWDANGQLTVVQDSVGETHYEYDLAGKLTKRTLPNGVTTHYEYDPANRLKTIHHTASNGNLLLGLVYEYDAAGNRTQLTRTEANGSPQVTRYRYDALARLVEVSYPDGEVVNYTYDATGNRTQMTSSKAGITSYTYNHLNKLIQLDGPQGRETFHYDASGNIVARQKASGQIVHYTWDYENHLIGVDDTTATVHFGYDGDGRRLTKTVNGQTTTYIQYGSQIPQVLFEITDRQTTRSLLGLPRTGEVGTEGTLFYLEDGLGSVVGIADETGNLAGQIEYDAFGILRNTSAPLISFGFTGEQFDAETGLLFLRARYYDPAIGRFISQDPYPPSILNPRTLNRYVYVENNPTNLVDPSGLQPPPTDDLVRLLIEQAVSTALSKGIELGFGPGPALAFVVGDMARTLWSIKRVESIPIDLRARLLYRDFEHGIHPLAKSLAFDRVGYSRPVSREDVEFETESVLMHINFWRQQAFSEEGISHLLGSYSGVSQASRNAQEVARLQWVQENRGLQLPWNGGGGPGIGGGSGTGVGGVSLDRAAEVLVDLTDITGVTFDPTTGQVVLIGSKDLELPKMNVDNLVVAIRTIYSGQEPSISIDPCTPGVEDGCQKVVYNGRFIDPNQPQLGWVTYNADGQLVQMDAPTTFGTHFGWVMFESDRYLKMAGMGWNNKNPNEPFKTSVSGYISELDRIAALTAEDPNYIDTSDDKCLIKTEADRDQTSNCWRKWFVPSELVVKVSEDGRTMEFEPSAILTEARFVRYDSSGQTVDVPGDDPAVAEFVAHFNQHYTDFAREKKELAELIQLAKIVGLVRWLHDNNIPLDLTWVDRHEVPPMETPLKTDAIKVTSGNVYVYGGVDLAKKNTYTPADAETEGLSKAALAARSSAADLTWEFQHDDEALTTVALNLAPAKIVGGYTTARTDAFVPLTGGLVADFTRQYNSLDPAPGSLGRGWSQATQSLSFRRIAVPEDPDTFYTQAVLATGTDRTELTLKDDGFFYPDDLTSPIKLLGLTGDDLFTPLGIPAGFQPFPTLPSQPLEIRNIEGKLHEYTGFVLLSNDGLRLAFDPSGRLIDLRDATDNQVDYTYKGDRLTAISDSAGRGIQLTYNPDGLLTDVTAASDGSGAHYIYDASGELLIGVSDKTGTQLVGYVYDADGRLSRITDEAGRVVLENIYDTLGRVTSTGFGQGYALNTKYDNQTNTARYQDATGNTFIRQYDDQNRLVQETNPWGQATTLQYDPNDHLTSITDRKGNITAFNYDQYGFMTEAVSPLGDRTQFLSYNELGLPEIVVDSGNRMTFFEYDAQGRLTRSESGFRLTGLSPDGNFTYDILEPFTTTYKYDDSSGNLAAVQDSSGLTTHFTYDEVGNPVGVQLPGGGEIKQTFDMRSQLTAMTDPSDYQVKFDYDANGRLSSLTTPAGATTYQYNNGQLVAITNPLSQIVKYGYNPAGLLTSVTEPGGAETRYEYNTAGNLVALVDTQGGRVEYEYDAVGRPIAEIRFEDPLRLQLMASSAPIASSGDATGPEATTSINWGAIVDWAAFGCIVIWLICCCVVLVFFVPNPVNRMFAKRHKRKQVDKSGKSRASGMMNKGTEHKTKIKKS